VLLLHAKFEISEQVLLLHFCCSSADFLQVNYYCKQRCNFSPFEFISRIQKGKAQLGKGVPKMSMAQDDCQLETLLLPSRLQDDCSNGPAHEVIESIPSHATPRCTGGFATAPSIIFKMPPVHIVLVVLLTTICLIVGMLGEPD
jgi:hypothetical protein